jgi:hypothetical protein
MGWTTEETWLQYRQDKYIFLFFEASRTGLWPNHPPVQAVPRVPSAALKQHEPENNHPPQSSFRVKSEYSCTGSFQYASIAWTGKMLPSPSNVTLIFQILQ